MENNPISVDFSQKPKSCLLYTSMAITMINSDELKKTPFFDSYCWHKLKSIIFCAVSWHGTHIPKSFLLKVDEIDLRKDSKLIEEVKLDVYKRQY